MIWNEHRELRGKHALLSPSGYHWINYDTEKLKRFYINKKKVEEGTELHELASLLIKKKKKLAKYKQTLNLFVNDAISLNMESERILYYSEFCFGTADAISFNGNKLRIYDLKTGDTKASFSQLDVYAALFCLEYDVDPLKIEIEERIYQHNKYEECTDANETVKDIMNIIVESTKVLEELSVEYI